MIHHQWECWAKVVLAHCTVFCIDMQASGISEFSEGELATIFTLPSAVKNLRNALQTFSPDALSRYSVVQISDDKDKELACRLAVSILKSTFDFEVICFETLSQ